MICNLIVVGARLPAMAAFQAPKAGDLMTLSRASTLLRPIVGPLNAPISRVLATIRPSPLSLTGLDSYNRPLSSLPRPLRP